jgi:hypothetical protein
MYDIFQGARNLSWIGLLSSFRILSLFSVSGSSSVHIAISENFHANSHIIGLFSVSLFHGTQNTVISLPSPFSFSRNVNVFSSASGVCAKSTKYVAHLITCF